MKSILIRIIVLLAILSVPAYLIYKDYSVGSNSTISNSMSGSTTTTATSSATPQVDDSGVNAGQVKVEVIPVDNENNKSALDKVVLRGTMPDLSKKWQISDNYSSDAKKIIENRSTDLILSLKTDPAQYDKWIQLGTLRKTIDDYSEAANIWEYCSLNWPDSIVAYSNLGDLYGFYLGNFSKAESNMLKVVSLDPSYIAGYSSLSSLYSKEYGNRDPRVVTILTKGLNNNQQSVDLMIAIASYYKDLGDTANAKKYYGMALNRARELSNSALQSSIQAELNNL